MTWEIGLVFLYIFLLGLLSALIFMMKWVFEAHRLASDFLSSQKERELHEIQHLKKGFQEVTEAASKANLSLGEGMKEFEKKLADLNARVNMLRVSK